MTNNVSIATKPLVYSAFRYINNKVWNALAEYIDNSIQSYINNKDILSHINRDGKVTVSLNIDIDNDTITIEDNAFGIEERDYQRAFELANIPLDAKGLNEFGMGMKVSSIWLSDVWTVETSAYGEKEKKTITFNIKEVVDNQKTELPVERTSASETDHYTKVTLTKLSLNKPSSRQISYIKKHLASIYTKYLRDNTLELIVNDERLEYKALPILKVPYYKDAKGEPILWRKEIDFSAPRPNGEGLYVVKGFIGILETMSTSTDNGFLLFRRGRVIGSSYDDRYRPEDLCGQVGSPRYKRIFGELYLDGFDVSFTKNSFQEDGDFETFIELLKDELSEDKSFDIFGQAQNYTKPKTEKEKMGIGKSLIDQLKKGMSQPIDHIKPTTEPIKTEVPSSAVTPTEENTPQTVSTASTVPLETESSTDISNQEPENIGEFTTNIKLFNGKIIELTIRGEYSNSPYIFYTLIKETEKNLFEDKDKYTSVINLKNPFFEKYSDYLSTNSGIEQLAYVIKAMVTTELFLSESGKLSGVEFRNQFNQLFGII